MEIDPTARAAHWPARTRRLLADTRQLSATWLHEPLRACLGDFDRRLHDKSDRTRSHVDQQRYLATRQTLLQARQTFEQRFVDSIDRAFAQLGAAAAATSAGTKKPALTLSLLDQVEHELTTTLDQLVARNEARNGPVLVELGYRLAVLVAAPPLEGAALPLGPQAMARAFRDASAALRLPSEHDVLLLQSLENTLVPQLAALYDLVNRHLLADGILPRLRAFPMARGTPRARPELPPDITPRPSATTATVHAFDTLREPLVRRRRATAPHIDTSLVATQEELDEALTALQQRPSLIPGHVDRAPAGAARLRQALQGMLNRGDNGASPTRLRLGDTHDDVVELVASWLVQVAAPLRAGGAARALLGQLQLPLLRMALADHGFFEPTHAAQAWLARFAETARDWIDDSGSDADRDTLAALAHLADRTVWEPPTSALYTSLQAPLDALLAQLQRKAQLAERRHVEAMQGHDRLEQARRRAAQLMTERRGATPSGGLRGLVDRAWTDVLALTLLRHGEQGEAFTSRLAIADQLCGRQPVANPVALRQGLDLGLQQIGMPVEESAPLAQWVVASSAPDPAAALPSATALALQLKQRLGDAPTLAAPDDAPPGDPRTVAAEQLLRQRPAGDWFDILADDGSSRARKLAWHAPSGRCLLLDRRGQVAARTTLAQLARMLATGQARPVSLPRANPLATAWQAVARILAAP